MTKLDISKATVGYDTEGVRVALNNIHSEVIQKGIEAMDKSFQDLEDKALEFMVGQAGIMFKENMRAEKDIVKAGMNDCYTALEGELNEIVSALAQLDAELVTPRN